MVMTLGNLPVPATYIVMPDRKIAFAYVNADYLERLDPMEVIDALKALR
jgi:peroxiredoxin